MAKTKLLTRISTAALAAATALTFASCGSKSAMETVEDAANNNYTQLTEKSDLVNNLEKVANGGSIELRMDVGALLQLVYPIDLDLTASVKSYNNDNDGKGALLADIRSGGTSIADLLLYMADNSISASSNALFGDTTYGFSLDNLADTFNNSAFGENGTYSLGITAGDIDAMAGNVNDNASRVETYEKLGERIENAWKNVKGDVYSLIEDNGTNSIASATLTVGGKDVQTTDVSFKYTGDQLTDIINGALELAKDNESVKEILDAMLEAVNTYSDDMTDEDVSVDEMMDTINGAIDVGLNNIDTIREELEGMEFSLTIHISKSTKEIIGATVNMSQDENILDLELICGPSATDIDEISVAMKYGDSDETYEQSFKYEVTEDTNDTYAAVLTGNMYGEITEYANIDWDKKSGDLEIEVEVEDQTIALNGKLLTEKDSTTLAVNSIFSNGISIDVGEIALIINTNDTMPTNGAYTDILAMSEDEVTTLLNEIIEGAQNIVSVLAIY